MIDPRQRSLGLGTHIFVADADAAVAFHIEAFGAAELIRHRLPDGRVLFIELAVGPDKLLVSGEITELNALAPQALGGSGSGYSRQRRWRGGNDGTSMYISYTLPTGAAGHSPSSRERVLNEVRE